MELPHQPDGHAQHPAPQPHHLTTRHLHAVHALRLVLYYEDDSVYVHTQSVEFKDYLRAKAPTPCATLSLSRPLKAGQVWGPGQ
jgi:hypothetical protein